MADLIIKDPELGDVVLQEAGIEDNKTTSMQEKKVDAVQKVTQLSRDSISETAGKTTFFRQLKDKITDIIDNI